MTQAEKKSREKRIRRDMARGVAGQIKTLLNFQGLPESAANLAKLDTALKTASAIWISHIGCNLDIAPHFLRMVADALEGKLKGARYDDAIWKAYCKASDTGKRKHERNFPSRPLFSELYDALIIVLKEMGFKDAPTKDGLRHRLQILGWLMSKKQGRPLGKKNATRTNSKTVAAKKTAAKKTANPFRFTRAENEGLRRAYERRCDNRSAKKL
jgi:hypothetical protein